MIMWTERQVNWAPFIAVNSLHSTQNTVLIESNEKERRMPFEELSLNATVLSFSF